MTSEKDISNQLFDKITSPPFSRSVKDSSKAKRQRLNLISQIRKAVEEDGKGLAFPSDDAAFSKHGSLYQLLTIQMIKHDVDIYVGLKIDQWLRADALARLAGRKVNSISPHELPQQSSVPIVQWMYGRVHKAVNSLGSAGTVSQSKRGAIIKDYGSPKRDYDIIPAFVFTDDKGKQCHLIPSRDGKWEVNPTQSDREVVNELDASYPRDQKTKVLGYRDLVRGLKYVSMKQKWEDTHGITSFEIRVAVGRALRSANQNKINQKNIDAAVSVLNGWLKKGYFEDPYTDESVRLPQGSTPLTWSPQTFMT
jgi:hypothetical protein